MQPVGNGIVESLECLEVFGIMTYAERTPGIVGHW